MFIFVLSINLFRHKIEMMSERTPASHWDDVRVNRSLLFIFYVKLKLIRVDKCDKGQFFLLRFIHQLKAESISLPLLYGMLV